MKLLAFDTSTEFISLAVTRDVAGHAQVWEHTGAGGAQASATLIPAIEALLSRAGLALNELDAIAYGNGPGSFTGLRTACAVAQGLGFGTGVPLLPVDTLLAVAEEARTQHAATLDTWHLLAVLDARMGEVYAAPYRYAQGQWQLESDFVLAPPAQIPALPVQALAGNVFDDPTRVPTLVDLPYDASLPRWQAQPTAAAMLRLAPGLLAAGQGIPAAQALPRYVRDKVALTTEERQLAKAAR